MTPTELTAGVALITAVGAFSSPWIAARMKARTASDINFNSQFKLLAEELRLEVNRLRKSIEDNERRCQVQMKAIKRQATDAQLRLLNRIRALETLLRDMGREPPADDIHELEGT